MDSAIGAGIGAAAGAGIASQLPAARPGERPAGPGGGQIADRPGAGRPGERPSTLPARPGGGQIANRPGAGNRPGTGRPGAGQGGSRPRPGTLPAGNWGSRPGNGSGQRPGWADIDGGRIDNINGKWNDAIGNRENWGDRWGEGREEFWDNWGDDIRDNWHDHDFDFDVDIDDIDIDFDGWHYGWGGGYYHDHDDDWDDDWWIAPAFGIVTSFIGVLAEPAPIIYDYGTGGNVIYEDNSVYIGGEVIATADEFAESAAALATVEPPATPEEAQATEWLPLGRFVLTTDPADTSPSKYVELAIDKQGIISGSLWNEQSQQGGVIQGKADTATQRVAFRVGGNDQIVAETGLYNLTLDEVPLLIHFGAETTENYLLVRLPEPPPAAEEIAPEADPNAAAPPAPAQSTP